MERIGSQVKLPLKTAIEISLQGIRIRISRALVTVSGVVLGIAFLMSILSTEIIKRTTDVEQQLQQRTTLMMNLVKSEVGQLKNRKIAVVVSGQLSSEETRLLHDLKQEKALISVYGKQLPGVHNVAKLSELAAGANVLLLLGKSDKMASSFSLETATIGMKQQVILDSSAKRDIGVLGADMRRETFFGEETNKMETQLAEAAKQDRFRTIWIVSISLLVTVIGIANALLMSVTERFKEIGTMKCLGALSSFIRQLFLIESAIIGVAGSVAGAIIGSLFPMLTYSFSLGFGLVFGSMNYFWLLLACLASLVIGTLLSILAAIYPASFASRMVPAMALRSNV